MNYKMVVFILGRILMIMAFLMCIPLGIAIYCGEDTVMGFLIAIISQFVIGLLATVKKPIKTDFYAKEGLVIVGLCWILTSLFGALPFTLSKEIPSYVDAIFETVSGFTTTGATILTVIEGLSYSSLFWRCFTHWIGGMGVLVFVMAVLPKSHAGQSIHIMRAEVPGPQVGKLVSRMRSTARILYGIYMVLTLIEVICLYCAGMSLFDSFLHAFSTAGTGGFSSKNASIAAYDSALIDGIISVFMLLFGINFTLFYLILTGNVLQALKSEELHWYLGIVGIFIVLITLNLLSVYENIGTAFRYAFFQVSSIITTTGFITANYAKWPVFSQTLLMLLLFMGACAGSTGGGIKISRIIILLKNSWRELRHQITPRTVATVKLEGKPVDEQTVTGVMSYMSVYVGLFVLSVVILSCDKFSFLTNATAVATCINNVGPGLDAVGPVENFSGFSNLSKMVLSVTMLAGRLELYPIIALFSFRTWQKR